MPLSVINLKNLFHFSKGDKKTKFIIAAGLIGIIFIFLSDIFPKSSESVSSRELNEISVSQIESALEKRMENILSSIEGVGKTKVMITLQKSKEDIYQSERKFTSEVTYGSASQSNSKVEERVSNEENIIIIEDENGHDQALLIASIQPIVKGVVVVCQGGEDNRVKEKVINTVVTVLAISSNRVFVSKLA